MLRPILKITLFVLLLASGYFVGTFSSSAMGSKKVEYKVISIGGGGTENLPQFEALLNKMGTDGWEMVGITPGMFGVIFKR